MAGVAPREQAARLDYIGKDLNKDKPVGFQYIFVTGGAVEIGGMEMKSVIFQDSHIKYGGGPLTMNNVYFVNCTFEMPSGTNQQRLAAAILAPSVVTHFSTS